MIFFFVLIIRILAKLLMTFTMNDLCMNIVSHTCSDVTTNEYMGFGLSGATDRTSMLGADATIAYVDDDTGPTAVDYHLSGYVQVTVKTNIRS